MVLAIFKPVIFTRTNMGYTDDKETRLCTPRYMLKIEEGGSNPKMVHATAHRENAIAIGGAERVTSEWK